MPVVSEKIIKSDTFTDFTQFLDFILNSPEYVSVVDVLREPSTKRFYRHDYWHSFEELLNPFPEASKALQNFAFNNWDDKIAFSARNLKACYIIDEDFVNGGRAFVLFNLVASNWNYLTQINNQAQYWEHVKL
ncbi:MAG: hypothetical protein WBB23_21865 [Desulforhopalus sp.]